MIVDLSTVLCSSVKFGSKYLEAILSAYKGTMFISSRWIESFVTTKYPSYL